MKIKKRKRTTNFEKLDKKEKDKNALRNAKSNFQNLIMCCKIVTNVRKKLDTQNATTVYSEPFF